MTRIDPRLHLVGIEPQQLVIDRGRNPDRFGERLASLLRAAFVRTADCTERALHDTVERTLAHERPELRREPDE